MSTLSLLDREPVDTTSHEGLIAALARINAHPRRWNSPAAAELFLAAEVELAPVARHCGVDISDAVREAWQFWQNADLDGVENVWAYTVASVRHRLESDAQAQRKLTSVQGLRRRGAEDVAFLSTEQVPGRVLTADEWEPRPVAALRSPAIIAIRQFLVMSGFDIEAAGHVLESLAKQSLGSTNIAAACDRVSRNHELGELLGLDSTRWRALVALMLGTTRGKPGLVALVNHGHPDPMSVSYIRRASARLLGEREAVRA